MPHITLCEQEPFNAAEEKQGRELSGASMASGVRNQPPQSLISAELVFKDLHSWDQNVSKTADLTMGFRYVTDRDRFRHCRSQPGKTSLYSPAQARKQHLILLLR